MTKPLLIDLFCKQGGMSKGYYDAGFDVLGIDAEPQPNYPFDFIQADVFKIWDKLPHDRAAAYSGSPPCQEFTQLKSLAVARNGYYPETKNYIEKTRELFESTGKPYVIENVPNAPLINGITLCGKMFNLKVYRHRMFESNILLLAPPHIPHRDQTPSAGNGKSPKGFISVCGTGGVRGMTRKEIVDYWQFAMGIDWMDREGLREAIPPAYSFYIGKQLIKAI